MSVMSVTLEKKTKLVNPNWDVLWLSKWRNTELIYKCIIVIEPKDAFILFWVKADTAFNTELRQINIVNGDIESIWCMIICR